MNVYIVFQMVWSWKQFQRPTLLPWGLIVFRVKNLHKPDVHSSMKKFEEPLVCIEVPIEYPGTLGMSAQELQLPVEKDKLDQAFTMMWT